MIFNEYGMQPEMRHKLFHQLWEMDANAFLADAQASGIPLKISEDTTRTLYWLLLAEYANSTIADDDENQFKNRVFATIFRYGPTWEKRLEIQEKLRNLTEDDLARGTKQIMNKALHPGTEPATSSLEELIQINEQNTVNVKRDKLSGYNLLMGLLETDVTAAFIDRFRKLFMTVVEPERPLLYRNVEED